MDDRVQTQKFNLAQFLRSYMASILVFRHVNFTRVFAL